MNFREIRFAGHQPRVHPNGFIQLDITPGKLRLNVWIPDGVFCGSRAHPVHNHSYDIRSTIIRGALTNVPYFDTPALEDRATHILHRARHVPGTVNESVLEPLKDKQFVRLFSGTTVTCISGDTYTLQKSILHDSLPHGLTATLMRIEQPDPLYGPLVAVPVGVKPHNFHRRETDDRVTLGLMWDWIEQAVGDGFDAE